MTNSHGWPQPQGEWSAIYRVTVDLVSDDGLLGRGTITSAKGTLILEQREAAEWSAAGLSVMLLRGRVGGQMERTVRDVTFAGSWGDLTGIGAQPDAAPSLRAWLAAPGTASKRRWEGEPRIADGLVFGLIPTPPEAPTEGLTWRHEAAFIPSIMRDETIVADSTLVSKGPDLWQVDSTLRTTPDSTVSGTRTLTISSRNGVVVSGSFEGTMTIPQRPLSAVIKIKGRIEKIDAVSPPSHEAQIDAALRDINGSESRTRQRAVRTLGDMFPYGGRAAYVLAAAASHDDDHEVRAAAGKALARLGEQAAQAAADYLENTTDPSHHDLQSITRAVMKFGSDVVADDVAAAVQAAPRAGLWMLAFAPYAEPVPGTRGAHCDAGIVLAHESKPLVLSGVSIRDAEAVATASMAATLHAVQHMPRWPPRHAPADLLALLAHKDPVIAWSAARVVACLGAQDPETLKALTTLREAMRGPPSFAAALAMKGTKQASEVPVAERVKALLDQLPPEDKPADDLTSAQIHAIDELGDIGHDARPALRQLDRIFAAVYKPGTLPSVRALIVAEALCKVDRPTGERLGIFTITLRRPPKVDSRQEERVLTVRAQRAAVALGNLLPQLRSAKTRLLIGKRALQALNSYKDAGVHRALLRIFVKLGSDADFAVNDLTGLLRQTQRTWMQTLRLDESAAATPERASRTDLLVQFGNAVRREIGLRHGIVHVLGSLSAGVHDKIRPTLEQLLPETSDSLLRYEISRTLRMISK